jgi:hypothetical protein
MEVETKTPLPAPPTANTSVPRGPTHEGISKGRMKYPLEFSPNACDAVEAEALIAEGDLRVHRDNPATRTERTHTLKPFGVRQWTDDEEDIIEYILRVGLAFGYKPVSWDRRVGRQNEFGKKQMNSFVS